MEKAKQQIRGQSLHCQCHKDIKCTKLELDSRDSGEKFVKEWTYDKEGKMTIWKTTLGRRKEVPELTKGFWRV